MTPSRQEAPLEQRAMTAAWLAELRPVLRKHLGGRLGEQFPLTAAAILSDYTGRILDLTEDDIAGYLDNAGPHLHLVDSGTDISGEDSTGDALLPPHYQRALQLTAEGLDYTEAADRLGASPNNVKSYWKKQIYLGLGIDSGVVNKAALAVKRGYENRLLKPVDSEKQLFLSPPDLTDRERTILSMVSEGKTNAEIAEQIGLKTATVKTFYVQVLFEKLGARTRANAVALGISSGLIEISRFEGEQLVLPI